MKVRFWLIGPILLSLVTAASFAHAADFDPQRVGFTLRFADEVSRYRELGVYVMPGEVLDLNVESEGAGRLTVETETGRLVHKAPRHWTWSADSSGLHVVRIHSAEPAETMTLNVFVMVPASRVVKGKLEGYRIGNYPNVALRGLPIYKPPKGFIRVTRENQNTAVSPHFTLKQFLCKQEGDYPKFVVLQERLLLKLELILAKANESGIRSETFHVMSGYRTPYYNRAIGNVKYSRHVWGDAADIFVDESPRDGFMDDLNGDGVINVLDAGVMYDLVDGMWGKAFYQPFKGGLGRYRKTSRHPPFVHVDARGTRARWGD